MSEERVDDLKTEVKWLKRRLEFIEMLADGGKIEVNGIPWREAFRRFCDITGEHDPAEVADA